MKPIRTVSQSLVLIFFIWGAVCLSPVFGDEQAASDSVAIVNGHNIEKTELEREFQLYKQRLRTQGQQVTPDNESELKSQLLNHLIGMELVFQESNKKGIKVPTEEVDKRIAEIKQRYADPKAYQALLERMQMTEDQLRAQIVFQSAIQTLVNQEIAAKITITNEASKAFYDANPHYFQQPEQVHARHILVKVEAGADEKGKAKAKEKILTIKERAAAGEDFGELAKKESEGPSAPRGGDLGFFSRGRMVPAFEKAAFELKIKEISGVVETNFGYHLIQVLERKEAKTLSYDEVKDRIATNLRNQQISQQYAGYIDELRKTAKVETFVK